MNDRWSQDNAMIQEQLILSTSSIWTISGLKTTQLMT